MAALLCLQNRTGGSPPMGGGFFNQHNGDFCISRDTLTSAAKANREPTCDVKGRTVPTRDAIDQVRLENQGSLMRLWRQSGHSSQS